MLNLADALKGFYALARELANNLLLLFVFLALALWMAHVDPAVVLQAVSGWMAYPLNALLPIIALDAAIGESHRQSVALTVLLVGIFSFLNVFGIAVRLIGSIIPINLSYSPGVVVDRLRPEILQTWSHYRRRYSLPEFEKIVLYRARKAHVQRNRWWKSVFQNLKSCIAFSLILLPLYPVLFGTGLDLKRVVAVLVVSLAGLFVCAWIEGRSYDNDFGGSINETLTALLDSSQGPPLSDREWRDLASDNADYLSAARPPESASVTLDVIVPYIFYGQGAWRRFVRTREFRAMQDRWRRWRAPGDRA
ncbi:MAG: hypothetical protein EON95_02540 [Caulobacteraceae bacterium]|nr:MAG: hypothetical protein EON95_02540 [Caulobacteraceae bacterium]